MEIESALEQCKKLTFTRVSKPLPETERIKRLEGEPAHKECKGCKVDKSIDEFPKFTDNRVNKEYRSTKCKVCKAVYNKAYKENNREKWNTYQKEYNRKTRALA